MPVLPKPSYETYAQARAKGANRVTAYAKAGYKPHGTAAGRLERRPEVKARLAELRAGAPDNAGPEATIAVLRQVVAAGQALGTIAGLREARMAAVEAYKVQVRVSIAQDEEEPYVPPPSLTREQWILRHGSAEAKQELMSEEWARMYHLHGDAPAGGLEPPPGG